MATPTLGECDYWATKGVIAATALVGDERIRIGISHALTGPDDHISQNAGFVGTAVTSFELNDQPYIFALKGGIFTTPGYVIQIEDYGHYDDDGEYEYGAGRVYNRGHGISPNYHVESFELNGHPHLFFKHQSDDKAIIARIDDDPMQDDGVEFIEPWRGWYYDDVVGTTMTSFQLNGRPYIYAIDEGHQEIILQINEDPSTGWNELYKGGRSFEVVAVESFELNDHPYLFGLYEDDSD